jgi:hypothetical protein
MRGWLCGTSAGRGCAPAALQLTVRPARVVAKVFIAVVLIVLVTAPWFLSGRNRARNGGDSDGAGASSGNGHLHHHGHSVDHGGHDGGGHGGGDGGSH